MTVKDKVIEALSQLHLAESDGTVAKAILDVYDQAYRTSEDDFLRLRPEQMRGSSI